MNLQLKGAIYHPYSKHLTIAGNPEELQKFFDGFKEGTYTITKKNSKRSNDANAYAWYLIGKIAYKMHLSPVEVYRDALSTVAEIDTPLKMPKDALEEFTKLFMGDHIGRQVIVQDANDDDVYVLCRKGSSDFDTKRMSEFIESLVEDCKTLDIDIEDDGYIKSLLEEWK